jgi:non-ribosomal peptide synthetase component F
MCVLLSVIGEPLSWTVAGDLLEYLSPNTHFLNSYGVTETTVDCTYRRVFQHDSVLSSLFTFVPIGVPIPNYVFHIIEEEEGEEDGIGELFIGGPAVFQGYLNRSPNPSDSRLFKINEDMCYRTGDLVKIINGELAYIGRRDFQVKIRGKYQMNIRKL